VQNEQLILKGGLQNALSFDTETILGYARLLQIGDGSHHFISSFEDALEVLESKTNLYFGWNADYDIIALVKYLPEDNQKELHLKHRILYRSYELRYIPEKYLKVKNSSTGITTTFYDLSQFYGRCSLDSAASVYLNEHKVKNDLEKEFKALNNELQSSDGSSDALYLVKGKNFLSEVRAKIELRLNDILHNEDFIEYGVKDAILTQSLLELFKEFLIDHGLSDVDSFNSHASLSEFLFQRYADQNNIELPDCSKLNHKLVEDVKKFYKGGMFMCLKRGSFGSVVNLDVSSAYPYQLSKMPNLLDGHFEVVRDGSLIDAEISKGLEGSDGLYRLLGWVDAELDNGFVGSKDKDGSVAYRVGYRKEKITLFEYAALKKHNIAVDFVKAWVWIANEVSVHKAPFRGYVDMLYTERKRYAKGTANNLMLKLMLNSLYGKTAQGITNGIEGWLTNPFYASSITGGLRAQIIDRIYTDGIENKVIMISTDGLLVKNDDGFYSQAQDAPGLGDWDVELYDGALVDMCGIYELYKDGKALKTKTRGFKIEQKDENDKPISLRALFGLYRDEDKVKVYETHRVTLGDVYHSHNGSVSVSKKYPSRKLNYIITKSKELSIADKRMRWDGINTFGDLLDRSYDAVLFDADAKPIDIALIDLDRALQTLRESKQHRAILDDGIEVQTSIKAFLEAYMVSQGFGKLEFISYVHYATLKLTNESSNSCLFNHKSNSSISFLENKWFWQDFSKYVSLQADLHPGNDAAQYKTYIRGVKEMACADDEGHPHTFELMLDGGKLSPYYRSKKKRESAQRMSEVLYRLNGSKHSDKEGYPSVVFPNHDGYDCYVVLTFPHSNKALSLSEDECKSIAAEFLDRFTKMLCIRKGFPGDAQYALSLNYHPIKTKAIFDKHPHVDVHLLNALFSKSKGKFYRFNPHLSISELEDVKALWKNVLRSHDLLDDEDKKVDLKWSYIWLGKKRAVAQALYYSARSFTWDLLNYISLHDVKAEGLSPGEISMVDYLTSYNNRRQPLGFWSKLSQYANALDDSQLTEECPMCKADLSQVRTYNAEDGLKLFTQSSYFIVDCGHDNYKFYVRLKDGGGL